VSGPPHDVRRLAHDRAVFRSFYLSHYDAVQRFVARRVDDPYLAADLTADVFVAVIKAASTYRPGASGELAWLYGIARNVVATEQRRRFHERKAVGRIAGQRLLDSDDLVELEERIDVEAQARSLYQAMGALPEGERAVLELVALDGLTVTEAARALRITPVSARVRLHRARKALRKRLPPLPTTSPTLTEA
jgi:RNA polymerase sigma factor (sigma-70 family)